MVSAIASCSIRHAISVREATIGCKTSLYVLCDHRDLLSLAWLDTCRSTVSCVTRDADNILGDETEQEHQESLSNQGTPKAFWSSHSKDLNAIVSPVKLQARKEIASDVDATPTKKPVPLTTSTRANKLPGLSVLDRKTMEEERLARHGTGKRKREPSPQSISRREKINPMEGQPFSWQLGESAEAFVKRVPPLTTSALTCEWIWAANPYRDPSEKSVDPRVAAFKDRGSKLLADSLQKRKDVQEKVRFGPTSTVTRVWNQESKALQQTLTKLAVETSVLSGKVSLDPHYLIYFATDRGCLTVDAVFEN